MESNLNEEKTLIQEDKDDTRSVETANSSHENTVSKRMVGIELLPEKQEEDELESLDPEADGGREKVDQHKFTEADTLMSLCETSATAVVEPAIGETQICEIPNDTLAVTESENQSARTFVDQHIGADGVSSLAVASTFERVDKINDLKEITFPKTDLDNTNIPQNQEFVDKVSNPQNNNFEIIYNRMEPMLENEQQPIHGEVKISFESEIRKHVTEVQQQIGVLEDKFRNENREMKTSVETITAKNDEIANGLDNLEKQIRQQQQEELHKVEKMEQTISQNMKELHQNKEMLDRKMSENEERWNSVMRISDTENATIQLKEQMRLLEKLKQENLFQKDKFKDCMKEMQKAKDTEVATLRIQLQEAERRGRIHILRQEIEAAKKQIVISEGILTQSIKEMTTEISQLETKRSELQASLRNADAANLREKRALEDRIEFLGAEVVKRNTCISILETRLSKTKITMRSLDQLSESDYETYRGLVQRWQEDDGRLNVESDEIKQRFFRGDGQSIVETLTWVQDTISRLQRDCIHANDFQRMSDIIRNALRGDYSGIRTDFAFTERNCVVQ